MTNFHALILGILQGITEFLPISSTGHLVLLPKVFGWSETPLFFDTSLHLGTALAIIVYFWKEFYEIIVSLFKDLVLKIKSAKSYKVFLNDYSENSLLGMKIIVGSIPAGIIGFLLEDYFDTVFRQISWVAVFVILGSLLMLLAEKYKFFKFISSKVKKVENLKELSL